MHIFSGTIRTGSRGKRILAGLTALLLLGSAPWAWAETGLHDDALSTGKDVSSEDSPFTNNGSYSFTAVGDDTATYGNVSFTAFGLYSDDSSLEIRNSGTIQLTATGGTTTTDADTAEANVSAYGIFSSGHLENSGDISVTATAGSASAEADDAAAAAYTAYLYGLYAEESVTNSGGINLAATSGTASATADENYAEADAKTRYIYDIYSTDNVTNSGSINLTATADTATADTDGNYAYVSYAYALYASGTVDNSGDISVIATAGTATATADGNYAKADATAGDIYGIYSTDNVTNNGDIDITAMAGTATATYKADVEIDEIGGIFSSGNVSNYGAISVTAIGGSANADDYADAGIYEVYGIYSGGDVDILSTISVTATGGTATSTSNSAYAYAEYIYGIATYGDVDNSGDIRVTATAGTATSTSGDAQAWAEAEGIDSYGGGTLINSGNITVTATAGTVNGVTDEAYACGIYIAGDAELTNTGVIQTLAETWAYEVYVASGTTTLVDTYNLNLDGDPGTGSLYVASGATLDLNDAALTLTSVGDDFQWNTAYQIFAGDGTVSGEFGTVSALNPNVTVTYDDQTTTGSGDDTVSLAYTPVGSPFLEGTDLLRHAVSLTGSLVDQRLMGDFLQPFLAAAEPHRPRLYAAAGNVATDAVADSSATRNFFLTPYYTNIRKDASPVGYDSDAVGFVTGYEVRNSDTLYGFHLGYSHNELDFTGTGFSSNEEDQDILTAGLHAMGSLGHWTWRGRLTGFYAWHNYDGLTGTGLDLAESADYDSLGASATLMGGYLIRMGHHLLLPEAGIDYFWLHQEGFTTNVSSAAWEVHNDSLDEHQVAAVASLRWLTRLRAGGDMVVTPSASVGVRCLLTDDEIDVHQSVAGSGPVTVSADQDDVAATASGSLVFANQSRWSSELAYAGEYGDDTTAHSAWLRFNYRF